jgi:predicted metal-dependent HD superfamily phosphohydrolase
MHLLYVIGERLEADNLDAPDTQLMFTGQVHDDGFKQGVRNIVLATPLHQHPPSDGDAKQGLDEDAPARRSLLLLDWSVLF